MRIFKFRRSKKILPGVKLNIGKKGPTSLSLGKPGATLNVSGRGTKATVGIPGTGLSHSTKRGGSVKRRAKSGGSLLGGLILIGLVVSLFNGQCSTKTINKASVATQETKKVVAKDESIKVISANMRVYNPEEHGKFIDICFNRGLTRSDSFELRLGFVSYDQCGVDNCNKKIHMNVGTLDEGKTCVSYNVYLSKPRKSGKDSIEGQQLTEFLDNKLVKGNIKALEISVYKSRGALYDIKESDWVDKEVFNNL